MRVIHVVAGLDPADGGPSRTLPRLWEELSRCGVDVRAYTTVPRAGAGRLPQVGVSLLSARRAFPAFWKRSPGLERALLLDMPHADVCHNHGCWLHPNWVAARVARRARTPLVISPLGHLDEWSLNHHRWRKRAVRVLFEERSWRSCEMFIAKSEMEAAQIRRLGVRQGIEVIPNGIDTAAWGDGADTALFLGTFPSMRDRRLALFLSRIHPKKGLLDLMEAWRDVARAQPDWHLVIAGEHGNAHGDELRRWVAGQERLADRITFVGAMDTPMARSALAAAELFVLPSHSENFGQVVLEALATGVPVITTKGCPWSGLETHGCGWWIETGAESLGRCLADVLPVAPARLRTMGAAGRRWAMDAFALEKIADRHRELYLRLIKA